jgi:hypothetical protein
MIDPSVVRVNWRFRQQFARRIEVWLHKNVQLSRIRELWHNL